MTQAIRPIAIRPDPEVRPPEYRVPRGRSGYGAVSALDQLLADLERIRRAKEFYGELPRRGAIDPLL
jgi:hypothetical protein